jgi:hypothetical protein
MRPPMFGWHEPVTQYGRRLGAIVDVQGQWIPVCSHRTCMRRLVARPTRDDARDAVRAHWTAKHTRRRAA